VFWVIIKELYFPESPYSFSVFASDILGSIYEIFLSEKLAKENGTLQLVKKAEDTDKDIITTPLFIIQDIIRQTVVTACSNKSDKEILSLNICDLACGSGAFLLETFQLLSDILVDYYLKNDSTKLIQTSIDTYKLPFIEKKALLLECLHGIDKDYNAVEATKFGLLLKLLEDESTLTVEKENPILPSLDQNIKWGNTLVTPQDTRGVNKDISIQINPYDFEDSRFDVIIGNPPYMKSEDMKNITPYELPIYKKKYGTAYKQFDKYFLFIERAIGLLKDGGYLGYIVPSKFTKVGAGEKLRHLLASNGYLERIISFGANQIFDSKTTYTCLLVLKKSKSETCDYFEVKNLSSWKVRNIAEDDYEKIQANDLDDEVWILVPPELKSAFDKINAQSTSLGELLGEKENISNGIQTSANSIYVIQPTKEDKKYFYFENDGKQWKVEKELTRPYFHTSSGIDNLYTYRLFKPNSIVIYPYKKTKDKIEFVKLTELKKKYPNLHEYFQYYKNRLVPTKRDIKPVPKTNKEWYRYGRSQALESCDVPEKIVVGVLSQGNKYAIDRSHTLISSGGTAGYCMIVLPEDSLYSIYYIQALLNSKYVEWYSALIGEVFRGGYIARGTKILKQLPIRTIDFSKKEEKSLHDTITESQKELIKIQGSIDAYDKNPRSRKTWEQSFEKEMKTMESLLSKLYNLGDDDIKIPLIKEIYAAD
jgi:type I restriction-modification system DNA methylase subunit